MSATGVVLSPDDLLARLPYAEPFRFVDEILSVDDDGALATYRWREDADFYRGHFPGRPVTPGVLLLECMAQGGLVTLALYLGAKYPHLVPGEPTLPLFSDAKVEFQSVVKPGERTVIRSRKLYLRRGKLCAHVTAVREDGTPVSWAVLSGVFGRR